MPHIFWLVFCKGQTVGERVCVEGPHYLTEQPRRSPQGAAHRNKNSMCGTRVYVCRCVCLSVCICDCVCVSCVSGQVLKTAQLEQRWRMTALFNDKNTIIMMTNNSSVRASELKLLKLKTSIYAQMAPLHWSCYIYASKHPLSHLSSHSSPCPLFLYYKHSYEDIMSSMLLLVRLTPIVINYLPFFWIVKPQMRTE